MPCRSLSHTKLFLTCFTLGFMKRFAYIQLYLQIKNMLFMMMYGLMVPMSKQEHMSVGFHMHKEEARKFGAKTPRNLFLKDG